MTNTELGDRVEAAIARLPGWKSLHPLVRQGSFDVESPTGVWVEVKACSEDAEWKMKPKAREVVEKLAHAERNGRKVGSIIAVVSRDLTARIWYRDELRAWRLPADGRGWTLVGEVTI